MIDWLVRATTLAACAVLFTTLPACAQGLGSMGELPEDGSGGSPAGEGGATSVGQGGSGGGQATTTSSTSTPMTTVPETGSSICDTTPDSCWLCSFCAEAAICRPQLEACEDDEECIGLKKCLGNCQDQYCEKACKNIHGAGMARYEAYVSCVTCDACFVSCKGAASGC